MMILRVVTLFPYYDLGGGHGKIPTEMTLSMEGPTIFFSEKEKKIKICYWTLS